MKYFVAIFSIIALTLCVAACGDKKDDTAVVEDSGVDAQDSSSDAGEGENDAGGDASVEE